MPKPLSIVLEGIAEDGLDRLAGRILSYSSENLVRIGAVDTGELLGSGRIEKERHYRKVVYDAPHAVFIEYGSEPHRPPVEPLIAWAKRRLGLADKEAESAGWAIAAKIEKEGLEPRPFLRPAVVRAKAEMS